jgi:hypothetical protein
MTTRPPACSLCLALLLFVPQAAWAGPNQGETPSPADAPILGDVPERPAPSLSQVYVWIDGNPIPPNPGTPYEVRAIGDGVVAINGFIAEVRPTNVQKLYDPTPMGLLYKHVDEAVAAARREGKTGRDIYEVAAAVLRAEPELVRSVDLGPNGTMLVATYADGRQEHFAFGPPPRPPRPQVDRATEIREHLARGSTVVVSFGGSGWLYVSASHRAAFLAEVNAALVPDFSEASWGGRIMPPFVAKFISRPRPLRPLNGQRQVTARPTVIADATLDVQVGVDADLRIMDPLGRSCGDGPASSRLPDCVRLRWGLDMPNGFQIDYPLYGTYRLRVQPTASGEMLLVVSVVPDHGMGCREYRMKQVDKDDCLEWPFTIGQGVSDGSCVVRLGDPVPCGN